MPDSEQQGHIKAGVESSDLSIFFGWRVEVNSRSGVGVITEKEEKCQGQRMRKK